MPDSIPTETPVGKIPAFFIGMFGPDYKTTLSGYATSLGLFMVGVAPFMSGTTAKVLGVIGAMLAGGGAQQMGQHSKDKASVGVETK